MLVEEIDEDGVPVGRAAHQGPDVDGTTALVGERAAPLVVGDLVEAVVTGTEGVDLLAEPVAEPAATATPWSPAMSATAPAATRPSNWNLPNALTVLRILLVPVMGVLLVHDAGQDPWWRLGALAVFVLAIATDRVDGEIARRQNLVTDFGKVADPIADKALVGTTLVLLSVLGLLPWWVTVLVLVREIGITLMRFVVIRHGVMPAGRGGKLKTVLQSVALGFFLFPTELWLGTWAVVIGWVVMARGRAGHARHRGRLRRPGGPDAARLRPHRGQAGRPPGPGVSPGRARRPRRARAARGRRPAVASGTTLAPPSR